MADQRTPWFPATMWPLRHGVYERDHGDLRLYRYRFSHWDGERWGGWAESPQAAERNRRYPSMRQDLPWRGLRRAPFHQKPSA
jgi:hypothetical protein